MIPDLKYFTPQEQTILFCLEVGPVVIDSQAEDMKRAKNDLFVRGYIDVANPMEFTYELTESGRKILQARRI